MNKHFKSSSILGVNFVHYAPIADSLYECNLPLNLENNRLYKNFYLF